MVASRLTEPAMLTNESPLNAGFVVSGVITAQVE